VVQKKTEKISILQTGFVLILPLVFIFFFCLYLLTEDPLDLVAFKQLSFPLKMDYLERPIKVGYILKTFSGNPKKVTVSFDFYDNSKKLLSRLTYVLSGEKDHWNYSNQTVSEVNYITILNNNNAVLEKLVVVFKNILKDLNEGIKKINAQTLESNDIVSVVVTLQAWYDTGGGKGGNVSASFYSWDKYLIN